MKVGISLSGCAPLYSESTSGLESLMVLTIPNMCLMKKFNLDLVQMRFCSGFPELIFLVLDAVVIFVLV